SGFDPHALLTEFSLWHKGDGPADLGSGRVPVDWRGLAGRLPARTPRREGRSDGGTAVRVNNMNGLLQDVRYALRQLRKSPGFTAVTVTTLALGIGANTAIFQMLDAVTMRSLPVSNPTEIVEIDPATMGKARGSTESWHPVVTNPLWEEIR